MKALKIISALVVLILLATACRSGESSPKVPTKPLRAGETIGVTDTEIRIGTLLPLSGYAASWGVNVNAGMQAYFDYINNDQGGVNGRKIKLFVFDDQYAAPLATEGARKLVEQDKVFAIMGSLGTAAHSAIYQYLEENGVPDMFILSGVTKFTDPVARNRFGFIVDYKQEGQILAQLIAKEYPGKKLGILAQNDDFGTETVVGIKIGLQDAHMEISVEKYDETQTDVTAQTQRLKNADVDVVVLAATPLQAASFFKAARETLSWDVPVFVSSVDTAEVVALLAGYENIEGSIGVTIGKQAFHTEDPGIALHHEIIAKYAPDTKPDNLTLVGATLSELMVEVLKQAGQDLTR